MAQSQADAIDELRDQLDEQHKMLAKLRADVDALSEKVTAPPSNDSSLRAEFDKLKEQLGARLGHSLD